MARQEDVAGGSATAQASLPGVAHLVALPGKPVRVSKRDARCWFDQLQAPRKLHRWFAKPPVQTRNLLALGVVTEEDVRDALKATGATKVHLQRRLWPVSRVWPMGFSWSSYVAQEELISVSVESVLGKRFVM